MKSGGRVSSEPCRAWLMVLLLLLYFLISGAAYGGKVDLYAVIVGVSKYKDSSMNLKLAAKDARDVANFLNERKRLVSKLHMKLLLNEDATAANISRALTDDLKEATKDDIVIIFLAGHGNTGSNRPQDYYFSAHDTALLVNDSSLLKEIKSERLLLVADACHSGGYLPVLKRGRQQKPQAFFPEFSTIYGRFGMSSASPKEDAQEFDRFGNGLFTFFFLKGLRGSAETDERGVITVQSLFNYVSQHTRQESQGKQNPQLYCIKGEAQKTPVYMVPVYSKGLKVELKLFYEDQGGIRLLTNDSVLESGQHVGVAFKPNSDCYVHILWWDSSGRVGRLFPNPQLTEGTGEAKAGQTYWLPSRGERQWYVLDDKPGYETVYFVASRERNPKLEELYDQLKGLSTKAKTGAQGTKVAQQIEREINLMGFAEYTVPVKAKQTFENKEKLFEEMESKIKVAGAEAFFQVRFKHESR